MAERTRKTVTILMADDDPDDRDFAREALADTHLVNQLRFVVDGQDLMQYLRRQGPYSDPKVDAERPGIILLDLNMPRMDGHAALAEIKSDPNLCQIPVVVLTTSTDEEDIVRSYQLGVNSFISKPVTFAGMVKAMRTLRTYWLELVELPIGRPQDPEST